MKLLLVVIPSILGCGPRWNFFRQFYRKKYLSENNEPEAEPNLAQVSPSNEVDTPFAKDPWKVDNFDDLSNWEIEIQGNNPNGEQEYYTARKENVQIKDGHLVITPLKEKYENREYTSGRLHSKFFKKYGKIEVVARTPAGTGLWPAIWMMPQDNVYGIWPRSGEIDIYEGKGKYPHHLQSTLHFGVDPNHPMIGSGPMYAIPDTTTDFHTYTVEWTPKNIIFGFDGKQAFEANIDTILQGPYTKKGQPFDQDFHIILNVAVGGNYVGNEVDPSTWSYPASEMWVKSVKWYEYTGGDNPYHPSVECKAKDSATDAQICGAAFWACDSGQKYANVSAACTDEWRNCCKESTCSHDDKVRLCNVIFELYDSILRNQDSCSFNGIAHRVVN